MAEFSTIEDFLNNDSFVKWVLTGTDNDYWLLFKENYPEKTPLLLQSQQIILTLQSAEEPGFAIDSKKTWSRIQQTLNTDLQPAQLPIKKYRLGINKYLSAIIIVLVFLASGSIWYFQHNNQDSYSSIIQERARDRAIIEKTNENSEPLIVHLPDGSTATLDKYSKISYPEGFDSLQREVYLTGEAFFNVTKDRKRPFYVYAGELVTKVLGTSFNIRAFENDPEVVINVQSGRVSVSPQKRYLKNNKNTASLILLPNQEGVYNKSAYSLNKTLSATPLPISPPSSTLLKDYEDISVVQLFSILSQVYEVQILFNQEDLASCYITTNLTNQTLFESLEIICTTIGATFNIIDAQIIIESGGCNAG